MENIKYTSKKLTDFYASNRVNWEQLYPSEKSLIESCEISPNTKILDIGCGCGGLGQILKQRFGTTDYCGIDINSSAIALGKEMFPTNVLIEGDFLDEKVIAQLPYLPDMVFSLSCVDWNVKYEEMIEAIWNLVPEKASLVMSCRLTNGSSVFKIEDSYQYLDFENKPIDMRADEGLEKAPYIVVNASEFFQRIGAWKHSKISAFGYYGAPSKSAVTKFDKVCFAVFCVQKAPVSDNTFPTEWKLNLPKDILLSLNTPSVRLSNRFEQSVELEWCHLHTLKTRRFSAIAVIDP